MSLSSVSRTLVSSLFKRKTCSSILIRENAWKLYFSSSSLQLNVDKDSSKYKRPLNRYQRFVSEIVAENKKKGRVLEKSEFQALLSEKWSDPEIKAEYQRAYDKEMAAFKAPFKKIPRKPPNAYCQFLKEHFRTVRSENPDLKTSEVVTKVSEMWKETPEEKKELLKEKAMMKMKQYNSDIVTFEENLTEDEVDFLNHFAKDKMERLHQKKLELLNFPKRPAGTFSYFIAMEKENFPRKENEAGKFLKRMASVWRNMTDEEKEKYSLAQKEAREKFEEDLQSWKHEHGEKAL